MNFTELQERLQRFADERHWAKYHSPKNLAMALAVEAAELLEHFQWLSEPESANVSDKARAAIAEEIADIQIYLAIVAAKLGIDVEEAVQKKIEKNAKKYPPGEVGFR